MKKIIYVVISLVVVYIILCLVGPKKVLVSRSIVINAPAEIIKTQLGDFHFFQEKWSPWTEKDPNMKTGYAGETGKPGAVYEWEGNKDVGKGRMEFLGINGDTVKQSFIFVGSGKANANYIVTSNGSGSNVQWDVNFEVGFKMRGMMMFMDMGNMIGKDFEKGLTNLKKAIEELPPAIKTYKGYEIKEITWEAKTFVGKKSIVKFEKLGAFFAENFPKIFTALEKNKVEGLGAPSCIYFTYDEAKMQTECAAVAHVANGAELKGFEKFEIPASKVLQISYYGPYNENMKKPHEAMDVYLKENNFTQTNVVEEYVTDPTTEKDSTKWLTNIYYILKK